MSEKPKKRGFFRRIGRGISRTRLGVKSPRGREQAIKKSKILEDIKDQETAAELAAFKKARIREAEKRGKARASRQKKSRIQRIDETIKRFEKTKKKLTVKTRKPSKKKIKKSATPELRRNPFDFV